MSPKSYYESKDCLDGTTVSSICIMSCRSGDQGMGHRCRNYAYWGNLPADLQARICIWSCWKSTQNPTQFHTGLSGIKKQTPFLLENILSCYNIIPDHNQTALSVLHRQHLDGLVGCCGYLEPCIPQLLEGSWGKIHKANTMRKVVLQMRNWF